MSKFQYTLLDYFYALDIFEPIDNLKEAYEYLYNEKNGDISNISEIYGNGESINLEEFNHDSDKIDDYLDELYPIYKYEIAEEMDDLEFEDYVITQGYKITLHQHEGKYHGEFNSIDNCIRFMVNKIKEEGHYPNIFIQNDRGNMDQIVLTESIDF